MKKEYTDEVVCPWCGYKYTGSYEFSDYSEGVECERCGKEFDVERNYKITYTTIRKECKTGKCEMVIGCNDGCLDEPYINADKNWTIYHCRICGKEVAKVSKYAGDKPRLELLTINDFK